MKKSFKKIISTILLIAMLIPSLSTNAFAVSIDTIIGRETEKFEERNKDIRSKYFEELQDATKLLMKGDDDLNDDVEIDDGEIEENKGETFGAGIHIERRVKIPTQMIKQNEHASVITPAKESDLYSILGIDKSRINTLKVDTKYWRNAPPDPMMVAAFPDYKRGVIPTQREVDLYDKSLKEPTDEVLYFYSDIQMEGNWESERFDYTTEVITTTKMDPIGGEGTFATLTMDTETKKYDVILYAVTGYWMFNGYYTYDIGWDLSKLGDIDFEEGVSIATTKRVKLPTELIYRQDAYSKAEEKSHVIKLKKSADIYSTLGLDKSKIGTINKDVKVCTTGNPADKNIIERAEEVIYYYSDLQAVGSHWTGWYDSIIFDHGYVIPKDGSDPVEANKVCATLTYNLETQKLDVVLYGAYRYLSLDGSVYGIYWDMDDNTTNAKYDVEWVTGSVSWTNTKAKFTQYEQGLEYVLPTNNDIRRTDKTGCELVGWYINDDTEKIYTNLPATLTGKVKLTAKWRRRIKIPKEIIYREDGYNTAEKAHVIRPQQAKDFYGVLGLNKTEIGSIYLGWGSDHRPKDAYEIIDYYSDLLVEGNWSTTDRNESKLDPVEGNGVNAALLYNNTSKKYDVYLFGMYNMWRLDDRSHGIYWDLSDAIDEITTDTGIDFSTKYGNVTWVEGDGATWTNANAKFEHYEIGSTRVLPTNNDIKREYYELRGWFINDDKNTSYTSIPASQTGNITLTANWMHVNKIKIPKELIYREDGFNTAPKAHVIKPKQAKDFYATLGLQKEKINSINLGWASDHRPKSAYELIDYYSDLEVEGNWTRLGRTETKLDPVEENGVNAALLYNETSKKYDVYLFGMYALWSLDGRSYGIYWDLSDIKEEIKKDTGIEVTKHYGQVTWVIGDNATWTNEKAKFDQYEQGTKHPLPTEDDIKSNQEDYGLDGWFINNDRTTSYKSIPETQTGNITLTANWVAAYVNIPKEMISPNGRGTIKINLDKYSWKSQLGLDKYDHIIKVTDQAFDTTNLTLVDEIKYKSTDYRAHIVEHDIAVAIASCYSDLEWERILATDDTHTKYLGKYEDPLMREESYDYVRNFDFNAKVYADSSGKHYVLLNQKKNLYTPPDNWKYIYLYPDGRRYEFRKNDNYYTAYLCWNFENVDLTEFVDIPKNLIGLNGWNIFITPENDSWKTQLGLDKYDKIVKITSEELTEEGLTLVETINYKSSEYRTLVAQKDIANAISYGSSYYKKSEEIVARSDNEELNLFTTKAYSDNYDFLIDLKFNAEVYKDKQGYHYVKMNDRKIVKAPSGYRFAYHAWDPIEKNAYITWNLGNITPDPDTRLKVGDRVVFGTKKNELHWTVIDKKDDKVLLLYVDPPEEGGIFGEGHKTKCYHRMLDYWGIADGVRQKFNSELYNDYFTEVEKAQILTTHLSTVDPVDPSYTFNTDDKIFALSLDEYNTYKSVIPQFLFDGENYYGDFYNKWGLRTRGYDTSTPDRVYNYVVDGKSGTAYVYPYAYSRPAMWVDFDGIEAVNNTEKETTNKIKLPKEIIFREDGFNTAARAHVIRPKKASDFYGVLGLEKDKIGSINLGWDSDHRPITAYKIIDYYSDLQVEGSWSSGERRETKLDPVEANGVNAVLFHNESNDKYDVYLFGMYAYWSLDGRSYGIYWDLSDVIDEVKTDTGIDLSSKYGNITWVEGEGATWINKDAKFEHYELGTTRALPTKDDIKRDKYELDGWFINEDKTTKHTFIPKAQTGNITLTANWKAAEQPTSSEEASTTKETTTKEEITASPSDATEESTKIEDATSKADESSSDESSKESTKEGEQSSEQESTSQTVAEEETTSEEETTKDSGNKKTATDSETDESTTESTNEGGNTQGGGVAPAENVDPITYSLFWDWTTKVEWNFTKAYEDNNDTNSYVYGIDYILPLKSEITVLTDGYEFESWTISGDYLEETENATKIPAGTTGGIILKPVFSHEEVPHTKYTMPNTWYERFGFSENKENIKEIHFVDNLDDITNIKEQKVIDDTTPTTDPTIAPTQASTEEAPTEATTESSVDKKLGEEVTFGSWNGIDLHWSVLDKTSDKALLNLNLDDEIIGLTTRFPFYFAAGGGETNTKDNGFGDTWETCWARQILNQTEKKVSYLASSNGSYNTDYHSTYDNYFKNFTSWYNDLFTEEERSKILTTKLETPLNNDTSSGSITYDKLFYLTVEEHDKYHQYMKPNTNIIPNYKYAERYWYLRTKGKADSIYSYFSFTCTSIDGDIIATGCQNFGLPMIGYTIYPMFNRPSMWVDISVVNGTPAEEAKPAVEVGERVTFGSFNGDPTEWIVLDQDSSKALLYYAPSNGRSNAYALTRSVSFYGAAGGDGNGNKNNGYGETWATCWARQYLNQTTRNVSYMWPYTMYFSWQNCGMSWYNDLFTDEEKKKILTTKVVTANNPEYGTSGGATTYDKLFLLSIDEINKYEKTLRLTENYDMTYSRTPAGKVIPQNAPDDYDYERFCVYNAHGDVLNIHNYDLLQVQYRAIRPAMWVDISVVNGKSTLMAPKSNDSEVYAFTGTETATTETVNKTYAKAVITNDNVLYVAPGENVDLTIDGNASNFFGHTYKGKFTNATVIDGLDKLDFSNTTNMHNFFAYCEKLKSVDVSALNTSKVTDMSQMFFDCKAITSLDLSTLDTKKVENMTEMFKNMSSLLTIYVSKDDMDKSALTNSKDMFLNDTKLVGGEGTAYDANIVDKTYANIDRKNTNGTKGYFTVKGNEPYTPPTTEDASYDIIWDLQGASFKDEYKSIYENAKHTTKEDYILPGEEVLNIPYANIFKNWTVDGVATTSISKNIHKAVTVTANVVRAVSSYETYSIGTYKQESNEPSNIEWVVLEKKDGKLLLTTKNIIDNKSYDEQGKSNFTQSSIKKWLNDDFYKDAFTKEQQDKILDTTLAGNQKAKVFLLTEQEVSAYYPEDVLRIARATNYAMNQDNDGEKLSTRNNNIAGYWLMTSENTEDTPYVSNTGKIVKTGEKADANHIGVRPCIWVTEKEVKEIRVLSFGNFMKEIGKQIDTFFRFMGFFSNGNKKGK